MSEQLSWTDGFPVTHNMWNNGVYSIISPSSLHIMDDIHHFNLSNLIKYWQFATHHLLPDANVQLNCTVLIRDPRNDNMFWIQVPCQEPLLPHVICKYKNDNYALQVLRNFSVNQVCEKGDYLLADICYKIGHTNTREVSCNTTTTRAITTINMDTLVCFLHTITTSVLLTDTPNKGGFNEDCMYTQRRVQTDQLFYSTNYRQQF